MSELSVIHKNLSGMKTYSWMSLCLTAEFDLMNLGQGGQLAIAIDWMIATRVESISEPQRLPISDTFLKLG